MVMPVDSGLVEATIDVHDASLESTHVPASDIVSLTVDACPVESKVETKVPEISPPSTPTYNPLPKNPGNLWYFLDFTVVVTGAC